MMHLEPELGGHSWLDEEDYVNGAPELIVEVAANSAAKVLLPSGDVGCTRRPTPSKVKLYVRVVAFRPAEATRDAVASNPSQAQDIGFQPVPGAQVSDTP